MRKVLISLLLASAAATPALAERPHWSDNNTSAQEDRQQAREDRQSAREERSSQSNTSRPDRSEQRSFEPRQQFQPQGSYQPQGGSYQPQGGYQPQQQSVEHRVQPNYGNAGPAERSVEAFRQRQQTFQADREQRVDQRADRLQQLRDNREVRQANRDFRNRPVPVVSNVPRPGTQPPLRVEQNHAPVQWSSNWRHDSRYDWQNYRHHHRSIFHLGFYYDPFGWDYSPFQIGWRLWPNYYSSNFWINDPYYYRLPYAPPGTRWIRYYDDAILVDMWSGQVVDVIYDFFW